jgi:gamma-glutamylcyclotransferase (GGCT)/AIG2-like uncharacterized protein YtfP
MQITPRDDRLTLSELFEGAGSPVQNLISNLGMATAQDLGALAQGIGVLITLAGIVVGFLLTYSQLRQANRTLRLQLNSQSLDTLGTLYERLYQIDEFDSRMRVDFEYHFASVYAPAIEKRLVYQKLLTAAEINALAEVNAILNFFEHSAHLSRRRGGALPRLMAEDHVSVFDYWFNVVMRKESHAVLRRYLTYGYECISQRAGNVAEPVYVATYGTLMTGEANRLDAEVRDRMTSMGPCRMPGTLYLIAPEDRYPGLKPAAPYSGDVVLGELYRIGEHDDEARDIIHKLDRYERYHVTDPAVSEYERRYILVEEPTPGAWTPKSSLWERTWRFVLRRPDRRKYSHRGAWVYFHKSDPSEPHMRRIPSGDWRTFQLERQGTKT